MTRLSDKQRRLLVDFADGRLDERSAAQAQRFVDESPEARRTFDALNDSLALANDEWRLTEGRLRDIVPQQLSDVQRPRSWRMLAFATAVAAAVLAVLVFAPPPTAAPAPSCDLAAVIAAANRERAAAKLLAVGDVLAAQPGGEKYARRQYQLVTDYYPDTSAAAAACRR